MTAITDNHMLKIPTASEFINSQVSDCEKEKRRAIKKINEQIERVINYIREASNGEHYMKVYKEIRLSLDVEKDAIGMQEVLSNLKSLGYRFTVLDHNVYMDMVKNESDECREHSHDIFSTDAIGNCGKSFDERNYKPSIHTVSFQHRKPKSWLIMYTK